MENTLAVGMRSASFSNDAMLDAQMPNSLLSHTGLGPAQADGRHVERLSASSAGN